MEEAQEGIGALRAEFDAIDGALLRLVAERRAVSRRIAAVKRSEGLPLRDAAREAELLAGLQQQAALLGLPSELVERLYGLLLADSLSVQAATPPTAT